ncbi:MAG: flagellar M-ring protein FliF [Alphaproteobacteria bacterium RIFCSPHIGHO2_12_FULL_63_12]|nr:MAG: flagellar M-ring protein FliF [Alphaproteobacteria bacterium RIFCSPHIGHO2_12_FULL_63_12]
MGMVRSFGMARLAAIIGVTIGVALVMGLIVMRLGEEPMTLLYADLDLKDAQDLTARLEQEGVKYDLRETGGKVSVYAPRDDSANLKIKLAGDGFIATSGSVGYEIFDKQDALGSTSFQQGINRLRALEGELARTIATISGVRSARVHLVLPERELFSRDKQQATASIVVDAPGGLDSHSVRAIANLAASAVPSLSPSRVTILDNAGDLLASGQEGDDPMSLAGGVGERTAATEARIRHTVEELLGRIVGPENMRVQVAADIDFSRVTETSNIIDPDSQTVLSATTVEDASNSSDPALTRGVTVANQLPETQIVDPQAAASATQTARRTEETTNYEMTRTVRNEVREMGGVKRLSVAVALNLATRTEASGAVVPAPRSAEELERIEKLVRSAVGYNAARGDQIDVIEAPFQPVTAAATPGTTATAASNARQIDSGLLMRGAEIGAFALVALALIIFVLRPLMGGAPAPKAGAPSIREIAGASPHSALPAPAATGLENLIDLAQVDGKVKASSLKRVAEVVKAHSDESAGILKSWIRQAS